MIDGSQYILLLKYFCGDEASLLSLNRPEVPE